MKRFRVWKGLKMLALAASAVALLGLIVMSLWNAVLPAVTGFHAISFMQALALLVLSRILFGGLRGRWYGGRHWRARMQERWQQMTPEERERFRSASNFGHRCRRPDSSVRDETATPTAQT